MPNITFSNPLYKDKTVYAVAGSHTKTVLALAREKHIPIESGCKNGECSKCLVKVTSLSSKAPMGGPLTDREIAVLKDLGKITQQEIDLMRVDNVVRTVWRLACQMVVRNEDLVIEYMCKAVEQKKADGPLRTLWQQACQRMPRNKRLTIEYPG